MAQQQAVHAAPVKSNDPKGIVQMAFRNAANASTPNGAIDVLGDALLELERLAFQSLHS